MGPGGAARGGDQHPHTIEHKALAASRPSAELWHRLEGGGAGSEVRLALREAVVLTRFNAVKSVLAKGAAAAANSQSAFAAVLLHEACRLALLGQRLGGCGECGGRCAFKVSDSPPLEDCAFALPILRRLLSSGLRAAGVSYAGSVGGSTVSALPAGLEAADAALLAGCTSTPLVTAVLTDAYGTGAGEAIRLQVLEALKEGSVDVQLGKGAAGGGGADARAGAVAGGATHSGSNSSGDSKLGKVGSSSSSGSSGGGGMTGWLQSLISRATSSSSASCSASAADPAPASCAAGSSGPAAPVAGTARAVAAASASASATDPTALAADEVVMAEAGSRTDTAAAAAASASLHAASVAASPSASTATRAAAALALSPEPRTAAAAAAAAAEAGSTPLHVAAAAGDAAGVLALLADGGTDPRAVNAAREPALLTAVRHLRLQAVDAFCGLLLRDAPSVRHLSEEAAAGRRLPASPAVSLPRYGLGLAASATGVRPAGCPALPGGGSGAAAGAGADTAAAATSAGAGAGAAAAEGRAWRIDHLASPAEAAACAFEATRLALASLHRGCGECEGRCKRGGGAVRGGSCEDAPALLQALLRAGVRAEGVPADAYAVVGPLRRLIYRYSLARSVAEDLWGTGAPSPARIAVLLLLAEGRCDLDRVWSALGEGRKDMNALQSACWSGRVDVAHALLSAGAALGPAGERPAGAGSAAAGAVGAVGAPRDSLAAATPLRPRSSASSGSPARAGAGGAELAQPEALKQLRTAFPGVFQALLPGSCSWEEARACADRFAPRASAAPSAWADVRTPLQISILQHRWGLARELLDLGTPLFSLSSVQRHAEGTDGSIALSVSPSPAGAEGAEGGAAVTAPSSALICCSEAAVWAAAASDTEGQVMPALLAADPSALLRVDSKNNTALHYACRAANTAAMRLLLRTCPAPHVRLAVNWQDTGGSTPLHPFLRRWAQWQPHRVSQAAELTRLFVEAGVRTDLTDNDDNTLLSLARALPSGCEPVADLLRKREALPAASSTSSAT